MKLQNLPRISIRPDTLPSPNALSPLVCNSFDDTTDNPRPGLGYDDLSDPTQPVTLIAKLPDVTRVGDTIELFWNDVSVQTYDLDQPIIDKGWLSFSVAPSTIKSPQGEVYYTLYDHFTDELQTSDTRIIKVNRDVPGGLDPNTDTAINENLAPPAVSPSIINSSDTQVTVTVPVWDHMEAGDELTVYWNGIAVPAPPVKFAPLEKVIERALKGGVLRKLFSRPLGTLTLEGIFGYLITSLKTLTAVGVPQPVTIPKKVLDDGGSSDKLMVYYEIRDIVDNYSLPSPPTYLMVNVDPLALPAPRLADADTATNQIDLALLGSKDARVQVQTGSLAAGDVVTVTWVGRTPNSEFSETLPSQTVRVPGFEILEFTIANASVLRFAGGSISATYTAGTKKSKSVIATISGQVVQLAALELVGAVGSAIDLAIVTSDPVTVHAPAYAGQTAGDRILLSWTGATATGTPVNYPAEYTVPTGGEAAEVRFDVPRLNLEPLGGGTLQLSYQVIRAGGSAQSSPVTKYSVTAVALILPLPVVLEATAGVVAPMRVINGATVQISYPNPLASDAIALLWNGKNNAVPWEIGATIITFTVPPLEIGYVLGKTIDVQYAVRRGTTWSTSPALKLNVLPLMEGDLEMANVIEATEGSIGVLDLSTFTGDAHVHVEPWPFIAPGQTVWLDMNSENDSLPILTAYPVSGGDMSAGINRSLGRAKLEAIRDGTSIDFPLKVNFGGTAIVGDAYHFPTLKLQITHGDGEGGGSADEDAFEGFETTPSGPLASPYEQLDHMIVSGKNLAVSTRPAGRYLRGTISRDSTEFKIVLRKTYQKLSMSCHASTGGELIIRCIYDGEKTDEVQIPANQDRWDTVEFTHKDIRSIIFTSDASSSLGVQGGVDDIFLYA